MSNIIRLINGLIIQTTFESSLFIMHLEAILFFFNFMKKDKFNFDQYEI